jgi:phosphatidylethanolamine-binding protein (PEBP) family uncharacterized protein
MKGSLGAIFGLAFLSTALMFGACDNGNTGSGETEGITVSSESIKSGRWLTVCGANNGINNANGQNKSPQLTWTAVSTAEYYAVIMFDTTANWLHWLVTDIDKNTTSLGLGAYTSTSQYVGPYPPANGPHSYKVTVFALKQAPAGSMGEMDNSGTYSTIVSNLDNVGGSGNIIAQGSVTATYTNGQNVQ